MELRAKQQRQAQLDEIAERLTPEELERLISVYEKKTGRRALNPAPQPDKFVQFLKRHDFHMLCHSVKAEIIIRTAILLVGILDFIVMIVKRHSHLL